LVEGFPLISFQKAGRLRLPQKLLGILGKNPNVTLFQNLLGLGVFNPEAKLYPQKAKPLKARGVLPGGDKPPPRGKKFS